MTSVVIAEPAVLSSEFLLGDAALSRPVAMREFRPDSAAATPEHQFSGRLRLSPISESAHFDIHHDPFGLAGSSDAPVRQLPDFDFAFFQHGGDILPLERGVIRRGHPHWEIVLQPGLVWRNESDAGWTRAAIPFALQERSANCTHNGVMTWLFNDRGEVSRVAYQVGSETCAYFKFDMWGLIDASYSPSDLSTLAAPHIRRLDAQRKRRLPVKPIQDLETDYPQLGQLRLGTSDGIPATDITVLGMVVDGIHYQSDCTTRHGSYPFCSSVPLPSYSTAKSIFAAAAVMRLEVKHPGTSQLSIASLVDECDGRGWRGVTIEHALDMATGNYRSAKFNVDEDSPKNIRFLESDKHADRIHYACNHFKRMAKPGSQFVYHTSDTYLVGVALDRFLSTKYEDSDLYKAALVKPIWHELRLSPLLDETKRTYDDANVALTGYGLTYEPDDIVRIAMWLSKERGQVDGREMLDQTMLEAAMQRDPDDRGLDAGSTDLKYNNGFWAFDAGALIACPHPVWVPFMSGYGGITIAMFPNDVVYYYFSDANIFKWESAIVAADRIAPLCSWQ